MKIYHVCNHSTVLCEPFPGGTEAMVVGLATTLQDLNKSWQVACLGDPNLADENLEILNIQNSPYDLSDDEHCHAESRRVCKDTKLSYILSENADVVHLHSFSQSIYQNLLYIKVPQVITLHLPPNKKQIEIHQNYSRYSQATLLYTAVSQKAASMWKPHLNRKIHVVPNGISSRLWNFKKSANRKYLLWQGRICETKGLEEAIDLASKLELPLKIAGPIFNQKYFAEIIQPKLNDEVIYVGHISQTELRDLYENAVAQLTLPNWIEPFGLTIVEAIASGVPVITHMKKITTELSQLEGVWSADLPLRTLKTKLLNLTDCYRTKISSDVKELSLEANAKTFASLYEEVVR